jgi:hypothetical protein
MCEAYATDPNTRLLRAVLENSLQTSSAQRRREFGTLAMDIFGIFVTLRTWNFSEFRVTWSSQLVTTYITVRVHPQSLGVRGFFLGGQGEIG